MFAYFFICFLFIERRRRYTCASKKKPISWWIIQRTHSSSLQLDNDQELQNVWKCSRIEFKCDHTININGQRNYGNIIGRRTGYWSIEPRWRWYFLANKDGTGYCRSLCMGCIIFDVSTGMYRHLRNTLIIIKSLLSLLHEIYFLIIKKCSARKAYSYYYDRNWISWSPTFNDVLNAILEFCRIACAAVQILSTW